MANYIMCEVISSENQHSRGDELNVKDGFTMGDELGTLVKETVAV